MKSARDTFIPPQPSSDLGEQEIQSSADVVRLIKTLTHLNIAVATFDSFSKLVFCSPLFAEFVGGEPRDMNELTMVLAKSQDERQHLYRMIESVRNGRVEPRADFSIIDDLGDEKVYELEILRFEQESKTEYVVILKAITDRTSMKRDMEQFDRLAALGRITAGVAHEFNNILTSVLGWTQIARQNPESLAVVSPALEIIETNSRRARSIASRLLGMSRPPIESCESISMVATIEEVLRLMSCEMENEKIKIVRSFGEEDTCFADENRLGQVFINIIRNAMDAMPGEGTLNIKVEKKGEFVEAAFEDTGSGMDRITIDRIFDPFFTTKNGSEVPQFGGTGLGLSICRDLIKEIGGTIEVDSAPRKGTRFVVSVPVTDRISNPPDEPVEDLSEALFGVSVLVVDDEPDIGEMICTSLKLKGLVTEFSKTGEEALAMCKEKKFDTAFVDFTMPGLSGNELLRDMFAVQPDLRVIIMSGREVEIDDGINIAEFLKKPFDLDDIQQKLVEVLGSAK